MIEAMGGRISVHSGLDEGSRFVVELTESSAPTPSDLAAVAAPIPLQRAVGVPDRLAAPVLRVLCIEDNAANIELIEQILSARPKVELLTAQDGGSGLQSARESQPDLVLLDLDLPDIRGERVLAELQRDAITERIPVVILSAATSAEEETERLLALGARSYISKPPGVTALLQAIDGIAPRENTAA
jgi:CheY-like chemotaxis protein